MRNNIKICLFVISVVVVVGFMVFANLAKADLPISESKNEFGGQCTTANECAGTLICDNPSGTANGGNCVGCRDSKGNSDCVSGGVCTDGICLYPGGNTEGYLCVEDSNCISQNCTANRCQAAKAGGGATPTPKTSQTGSSDALPGVDLSIEGVTNLLYGLVCWLTRIAGVLMVIALVLVGLRMMAARGNSTKFADALKNFQHVLIGILVIFGVYVIIATVANMVGVVNFSFLPFVC